MRFQAIIEMTNGRVLKSSVFEYYDDATNYIKLAKKNLRSIEASYIDII